MCELCGVDDFGHDKNSSVSTIEAILCMSSLA